VAEIGGAKLLTLRVFLVGNDLRGDLAGGLGVLYNGGSTA
jgi:hypothetical protein